MSVSVEREQKVCSSKGSRLSIFGQCERLRCENYFQARKFFECLSLSGDPEQAPQWTSTAGPSPPPRSLTGGTGRRRGFAAAAPEERAEAAYERAPPEGANRSFGGRAQVIKARDGTG